MGAVEHLKTLCCLGLPPESAMIAVTPLLHEIIPHGWTRIWQMAPDASIISGYCENPPPVDHFRENLWRYMDDPSAPVSVWMQAFRAAGVGWTFHWQGRKWLDSAYYRELEAPLDSCWMLDAMIADAGGTFAGLCLSRPRGARPFNSDDVQLLDRLRPWLAHALRPQVFGLTQAQVQNSWATTGTVLATGQMVLTEDAKLVFQTPGIKFLLHNITGDPGNYTRYVPVRDSLPSPVLKLIRQITGATNGTCNTPPRMQISTAYGVLTLEAKWLVPASTPPGDAARDPKSCLIAVTIELHEHAIAHAARALRESGATPAQTKVGIHLALGKPKLMIADELGIQLTSVADLTRKLYRTLDVHNSAELSTKIWLGQKQNEARQSLRRAG
jgi:DNA-binding CsgD family transcriptional regulator